MNLKNAWLVWNAKYSCSRVHVDCFRSLDMCGKQNIVQVVAFYIYLLTINEEISKIEKTYI